MRPFITRPFISLSITAALLATLLLSSPVAAARVGSNRPSGGSATAATLAGYIPAAVTGGQARLIGQHRGTDSLALTIGLPLRNQPALTRLLKEVSTPGSAQYRHYLTQAQANQAFNPTPQQERQVIGWLRSHGLRVTRTYPNHLLVDVTGSVAQIERLLHVTINDYAAQVNGKQAVFYAPANNPTVDASVKNVISTIAGLDNYPRFHSDASLAAPRPAANGTADNAPPYYPQDFANAYDVNPLWDAGYTGAGQHIGIVLWAPAPSDTALTQFATQTGADVATQANGRLQVIPVDGGPQHAAGVDGAAEAAMDVEYTSGMAPGATIDYYAAPNTAQGDSTDTGLEDALNQAGSDANNNAQISSSWGLCEAADPTFVTATEQILQSNTVTGHNYFFSSGDSGSTCVPTPDKQCTHTDPTPQYPASSAYVTSVGGTSFDANVNGGYPGEMAWRYPWHCSVQFNRPRGSSQNPPGGSGGGYSQLFAQPGWQVGFSASQYRGYPDVAADAGPATGAYICYGDSPQDSTCIGDIGGTSLATPMWAGMIADVEQYVLAQGELPLGFVNPLLYTLTSHASPYPAYHDMRAGTNGNYNAGQGWDAVTGLGSPDLYNLARDAASFTPSKNDLGSPLVSVAAISTNDVWAVGSSTDSQGFKHTLIEHWDGTSWSVVSSPDPSSTNRNVLTSVAAISSNDVWAVGYAGDSGVNADTLIEHWDGTSWSVVPSPNPDPPNANELFSVTAVSASDVWAVGLYTSISPSVVDQTLIEHWDGTSWSVVPSPNPDPSYYNQLFSVAAVSASDLWAVGYYLDSSDEAQTLIEHWDGTSWSVVPSPNSSNPSVEANELFSVAAVSATDVWAVGYIFLPFPLQAQQTLIEHWDGSSWSVVSSPNPSPDYSNEFSGVVAISAGDIWAVGTTFDYTLAAHWGGGAWNVVSSPDPSFVYDTFSSVAAVSASDVWAVGYYLDSLNHHHSLIEHWDGSSWNVVPSP